MENMILVIVFARGLTLANGCDYCLSTFRIVTLIRFVCRYEMLMGREDFARCRYTRVGRVVLAGFVDCQLERYVAHPSGLCEASSVHTPSSLVLDSVRQHDYISIGFRAYVLNSSQPNSGLGLFSRLSGFASWQHLIRRWTMELSLRTFCETPVSEACGCDDDCCDCCDDDCCDCCDDCC